MRNSIYHFPFNESLGPCLADTEDNNAPCNVLDEDLNIQVVYFLELLQQYLK